jgi:hypothetical protein
MGNPEVVQMLKPRFQYGTTPCLAGSSKFMERSGKTATTFLRNILETDVTA